MPANTIMNQVGKTDFFAVMAPGFFVLVMVVFTAYTVDQSYDRLDRMRRGENVALGTIKSDVPFVPSGGSHATDGQPVPQLNEESIPAMIEENWPLTLMGIVFATYVVGSIPRAMSVNTADLICKSLFHRFQRYSWDRQLIRDDFPYKHSLTNTLDSLKSRGLCKSQSFPETDAHTAYNHWKVTICNKSSNGFAFTQFLEAKTRLFAGMFWAGAFGLLSSFLSLCALVISDFLIVERSPYQFVLFIVLVVFLLISVAIVSKTLLAKVTLSAGSQDHVTEQKNEDCTNSHPGDKTVSCGSKPSRAWWLVVLAVAILFAGIPIIPDPLIQLASIFLLISLAISISFGSHLRRVRGQEANLLYLTYLVLEGEPQRTESLVEHHAPPVDDNQ